MKRFILPVALVATMFMLVSCVGSEEYQKGSTIMKDAMKKVEAAKSYDELDDAMDVYYKWDDEDLISTTTAKEDIKLDQMGKELKKLYEAKKKELCKNDDKDEWIEVVEEVAVADED